MPSTVSSLLEAAGLDHAGVVRRGRAVPVDRPGVYLVSLGEDPGSIEGCLPAPRLRLEAISDLIRERPELSIDSQVSTPAAVGQRVSDSWLADENVVYIGLAGTSVATRVGAYYRTKLGQRSPHAGGWFIKLLDNLPDLYVHYATADEPDQAEDRMLAAFVAEVSTETRATLRDPDHPFPFANMEWPKGVRKNHGIRGATGSPGTSSPPVGTRGSRASEQNYPRPRRSGTAVTAINAYLQAELRRRERTDVAAVEAARWLDGAGLLTDSKIRPGLPLRDLLRDGLITGQRQEPNHRWYIDRA